MSLRLALLALALLLLPACPGDPGLPTVDGGGDFDATALDGGSTEPDAPREADVGVGDDGVSPGLDVGPRTDGGAIETDAGDPGSDAGNPVTTDAGEPDACVPPVCPAPPPDCVYVGGDVCACGTLVCGTLDCGGRCARQEFCDYAVACAGIGACRPYEPDALCPDVYIPVCGCDGTTYSNECEAVRSGVDVEHDGECAPVGECVDDRDCGPRETCQACRGIGGIIMVCMPDGSVC